MEFCAEASCLLLHICELRRIFILLSVSIGVYLWETLLLHALRALMVLKSRGAPDSSPLDLARIDRLPWLPVWLNHIKDLFADD